MRIVFALPGYHNRPSGGYHVHYKYAELLSQRGHDVTILFPRRVEERIDNLPSRLKAPLWALRQRSSNRPLVRWFSAQSRVKRQLVRNLSASALPDADILIATSWLTAEALCQAPPRCGRKFYIVYDYEFLMTADLITRQRIEQTYRQPFGIVTTSSIITKTVLKCGGTPLAEIPCGLDFEEFRVDLPIEQRKRFQVGFPMRLDSFKGAADAIEAAGILRQRYGEQLRITTFGSHRPELPDWIEWLNYPSQDELRSFYNNQATFLLPSHFEGWGLPGVEAMACGAALVTADNGGCHDYAMHGETALVVPPRQPQQLADAIGRLIDDDALRVRLARAGQAFVQKFTWQDAIERLDRTLGL